MASSTSFPLPFSTPNFDIEDSWHILTRAGSTGTYFDEEDGYHYIVPALTRHSKNRKRYQQNAKQGDHARVKSKPSAATRVKRRQA